MDHGVDVFIETIKGFYSPAVLFSGGLDSSVMAFLAEEPKLYTLCASEQSYDYLNAERSSALLGLDFEPVLFNENDIREAASALESKRSLDIAHYILARAVKENTVLSGQGADELFLGYAKYSKMNDEEKNTKARDDFERWMFEEKEKKIFALFKKEIIFPYIALKDTAFSLPLEEREGKKFLRSLAVSLGLLEEIALQRKKAMQYGSGVDKVVKRLIASSSQPLQS
jgi:asparagine synthase (glutamine-hydrolysing)